MSDGNGCAHYDGTAWSWVSWTTPPGRMTAVWGRGPTDVYAGGDTGVLQHFDGSLWTRISHTGGANITSIWGAAGDVHVAGYYASPWQGAILTSSDNSWKRVAAGLTSEILYDVWGSSAHDVFVAGGALFGTGTILHYDGVAWSAQASGTSEWLQGVWGTGSNNVFIVGSGGAILHFNGSAWTPMTSPTTNGLNAIHGADASHVFAVGNAGTIVFYDGATWSDVSPGLTTQSLVSVWARAGEAFVFGDSGAVLHYNGSAWSLTSRGELFGGAFGTTLADLYAVSVGAVSHFNGTAWQRTPLAGVTTFMMDIWGSAADDLFIVGLNGTVLHSDGTGFAPSLSGTTEHLRAVWGAAADDVWAVGNDGALLHFTGHFPRRPGGACAAPRPIYCGAAYEGSNAGGMNRFSTYGCTTPLGRDLSGPEVFYRFESPMSGTVSVTLTPFEADLDLVVLGADASSHCDAGALCHAAPSPDGLASETVELTAVAGGTYFVVVDGHDGAVSGYRIALTCPRP